jgi:hypothetical protein
MNQNNMSSDNGTGLKLTIPPASEVPSSRPASPAVILTPIAPLLVGREDAAKLCGDLSPSTWDRHNAAGLVPAPRRLGGRPLWSVEELKLWISAGCPDRKTWEAMQARKSGR